MPSDFKRFVTRTRVVVRGIPEAFRQLPKILRDAEAWSSQLRARIQDVQDITIKTDQRVLFMTIGQALTAWATMEESLIIVVSVLLRVDSKQAGLVMYSIINSNVWLTVIHDLFDLDPTLKHHQARWNKIGERIRKVKDKRDQLAHHTVRGADSVLNTSLLQASKYDTRNKSRTQHPLDVAEILVLAETAASIGEDVIALTVAMLETLASQEKPSAQVGSTTG